MQLGFRAFFRNTLDTGIISLKIEARAILKKIALAINFTLLDSAPFFTVYTNLETLSHAQQLSFFD
jgi:hypothetical protein